MQVVWFERENQSMLVVTQEPDVEMNWNLSQFLPEAGACQTNFNVSHVNVCCIVCM